VPNAFRHSSALYVCIQLAWQWNRPSRPVVLDPPDLSYWTDSSNWDLVGRPVKAETTSDSRNPRKHAPTLDLDSGYLRTDGEPWRKGRAEAPSDGLV
jgi:hypothetical protein